MAQNKAVLFTRSASPYLTGDRATFSPAKAEEYVRAGKAQYIDTPVATNRAMSTDGGLERPPRVLDTAKAETAPDGAEKPSKKGKKASSKRKRLGE